MSKHTPAPWKITEEIGDIPMKSIIRTLEGRLISKTYGTNVEEIEATTKLQASAPELLEALEFLLKAAIHCDPFFETRWSIAADKAKAAIKKATL